MDFLMGFSSTNIAWLDLLLRIVSAIIIGGIIGFEREKHNRPAGLRTHILVCLGACVMTILESTIAMHMDSLAMSSEHVTISLGRISAQVVSGVGFLGAGTIVLSHRRIPVSLLPLPCGMPPAWVSPWATVFIFWPLSAAFWFCWCSRFCPASFTSKLKNA